MAPALLSFGIPFEMPVIAAKACPELAEGRESTPSTAHFRGFAGWILALRQAQGKLSRE
jgi:hypothetical protein